MTDLTPKIFTGGLYEFIDEGVELPAVFSGIDFIEAIKKESPGWYSFLFRSDKPLTQEDIERPPPYFYPFLSRISSSNKRLLLLSVNDILVNKFFAGTSWTNYLKAAQIKVPDLVRQLTEKPDVYCLSVVFARIDGYGRSLRTISLYGTDLAEAQLFRDILPKLVPYRAHLRDVRTGEEILQVGSKGEVVFNYRDTATLSKIDKSLLFLTKHGFLVWDE
jgi:hypothetical protein